MLKLRPTMTKQEQMKAIRETCNDCRDYLGLQIDKTQNDNDDDETADDEQ